MVSLGKFDGVHRGHATVLQRVKTHSLRWGVPSIVVSFDVPPISILKPDLTPVPLCTFHRKAELISELGVEAIVQIQTDASLLKLSANEFFQRFFLDKLGVRMLVEGENFTFGKEREGTVPLLRELCDKNKIALETVPSLVENGQEISSSRIRMLINGGHIETANAMLTEPYRISGVVVHGDHRGRTLGFPTANLEEIRTILPRPGIYACSCKIGETTYPTATHIGFNPTFAQDVLKFEAYLIGFEGNLYDTRLNVDFHARIREVEKFDSPKKLVEQMNRDVRRVIEVVSQPKRGPLSLVFRGEGEGK